MIISAIVLGLHHRKVHQEVNGGWVRHDQSICGDWITEAA